ncbi:phosphotransferase [Microdochium nivale]|nr:phosphotransferase [Microdochium nivale]
MSSRNSDPAANPAHVAAALLARSNRDLVLVSCRKIQTLWAGYGFICEVKAAAAATAGSDRKEEVPLILKLISPPPPATPGSAGSEDEGHLRKMLSYEVERYFYSAVAPALRLRTGGRVAVAECLATTATAMTTSTTTTNPQRGEAGGGEMKEEGKGDGVQDPALDGVLAILMTDLRVEFPVSGEKRSELTERQVLAAICWLAGFHGSTWARSGAEMLEELVLPPLREAERRQQRRQQQQRRNEGRATLAETAIGNKLWLNGGYTYLETRRKEFSSLLDQLGGNNGDDSDDGDEWAKVLCRPLLLEPSPRGTAAAAKTTTTTTTTTVPNVAEMVAAVLAPRGNRDYETLIHGDVKSENLFTTADHDRVAFFDFQYVGLGLGACDLAKLFTCSVPLRLLVGAADARQARSLVEHELGMGKGEEALLRSYHASLLTVETAENEGGVKTAQGTPQKRKYDWELFVRHWETALVDWHRFQVSWGQWGNVDWLEARVRAILRDGGWRAWLQEAYDECAAGSTT